MISLLSELGMMEARRDDLSVSGMLNTLEGKLRIWGFTDKKSSLAGALAQNHPHYITYGSGQLNPDLDDITIDKWLTMIFGQDEAKESENIHPQVVIGNIHQIKGEEYSYVFVCGFQSPAEQKNLYVAITRAEQRAYLCFENPQKTERALRRHRCEEGSDYELKIIQ